VTVSALVLLSSVLAALWVVVTLRWWSQARKGSAVARSRVCWAVVGGLLALLVAASGFALHVLVGWPSNLGVAFVGASMLLPVGLLLGAIDRALGVADRVLAFTIVAVGLVVMVGAIYLLMVIGLGRVPEDDERTVLMLSMAAAALAAILAFPVRRRLDELANQHVYGERRAPDEALKTFAGRMTRSVPMDELLLQLVESLKKTMVLRSAEIWTGTDGHMIRSVSVPDRPLERLELSGEELTVVARAHVQGNAWMQVWVPKLLEGRDGSTLRVAVSAHLGELLGLIVVERPSDGASFTEEEERVLTELARQVGLALHNVRLDSALQASLDELQVRNAELQASRLRIVTAADESRRQIERNLHDGAQQHLVALAVKVGLVKQLLAADPDTAQTLLEELRGDVQATLTELRDLAHGIYPPLLRDRGLSEALRTAGNRAVLPTEVVADDVGRYSGEVEAAVYFCCLEAMQNAGKHAGEGSAITVTVASTPDRLEFEVADDGAGFDLTVADAGHGFVNMRDRLGAVGGALTVRSAAGEGTHIIGSIPVAPEPDADAPASVGTPSRAISGVPAPASTAPFADT
jgi:signal transduction histidine kinase